MVLNARLLLLLAAVCVFNALAALRESNDPAKSPVFIVENPAATEAFQPKADAVRAMVRAGITHLTGKTSASDAWRALVSTQDVIGIKVFSAPGRIGGTRPEVIAAIVHELLDAGMTTNRIVIWDKHELDLRDAGYFDLATRLGVRVASAVKAGYDENVFYDTPLASRLNWGDLEFGQQTETAGRKSYISKLLTTNLTKIIVVSPLMNHNQASVAGNLYSLAMGSVDNTFRFETSNERLATAVPEIIALPQIGDRVVLNITDALICQYEGGPRPLLHYSVVLNQLRFSRDPVALDVLSIEELNRERSAHGVYSPDANLELYKNAALLELGIFETNRITVEQH